MIMSKIITERDLILAAAYIRMSRDKQADSPERQRRQIEEYAQRHGFKIVRWYRDDGMTGTESAKRAGYQQLLTDAPMGAFSAVLLAELSRMSREDLFSVIPQWGVLRDAGVKIVSCQRGEIDFNTMGGFITAIIDQFSSHDEVRKFADRSVTGKINKAAQGLRVGGTRVFGFDRQIVDAAGNVLKTVRYDEKFTKSIDTNSVLVPSDRASVDAIRWAFDFVEGGGSLCGVARELNNRGLRSIHGKKFYPTIVRQILLNPVYAGITRVGHFCRGKFRRMDDFQEPQTIEGTHAALIDKATFEKVSAIVGSNAHTRDKWDAYLLRGLCICGHCGYKMGGRPQVYKKGDVFVKGQAYACATRFDETNRCSVHMQIRADMLEPAVIKAWCDVFLVDDTPGQLKAPPSAERPDTEKQQLKALRDKIEKAEQNMALADSPEDFRTVSNVLNSLRKQEAELRDSISRASRKVANFAPDVMGAISRLQPNRKILENWPNVGRKELRKRLTADLAVVLRATIDSITLRSDITDVVFRTRPVRTRTGVISFNPEHTSAADVVLTDDMLASLSRRRYREVAELLRRVKKPMMIREICKHFDRCYDAIWSRVQQAKNAGLIRETEAGWVACD